MILSGGDPLSLSTPKLAELTDALADIPHVRRLRIHTRLPIVLPERVDAELIAWMSRLPWPVAIVLHANHANEIDATSPTVRKNYATPARRLLNQSVLLRGVNDDVNALAALSERLFEAGIVALLPASARPRRRHGALSRWTTPRANALIEGLRGRLSGYLVPRLVREIAGRDSKTPL